MSYGRGEEFWLGAAKVAGSICGVTELWVRSGPQYQGSLSCAFGSCNLVCCAPEVVPDDKDLDGGRYSDADVDDFTEW